MVKLNGAAIYNYYYIIQYLWWLSFYLSTKNVFMNKFTHEHRLNEYLITLKAFIMYKYSQEI